jgi:hypothetical protein
MATSRFGTGRVSLPIRLAVRSTLRFQLVIDRKP